MTETNFRITENKHLTANICRLDMSGDVPGGIKPGQFASIKVDGMFLRRPFSVCDYENGVLTVLYKVTGQGTEALSHLKEGTVLSVLTKLGNGFDTSLSGAHPLLIGGGTGVSPMYILTKQLIAEGKMPEVILGFNTSAEIVFEQEFRQLGCDVTVATVDGSHGVKGFVTDAFPDTYTYFYACGPEAMYRAINRKAVADGEFSLETRMGCAFGACMGCTVKTASGNKRVCKDGPVFKRKELIWED